MMSDSRNRSEGPPLGTVENLDALVRRTLVELGDMQALEDKAREVAERNSTVRPPQADSECGRSEPGTADAKS